MPVFRRMPCLIWLLFRVFYGFFVLQKSRDSLRLDPILAYRPMPVVKPCLYFMLDADTVLSGIICCKSNGGKIAVFNTLNIVCSIAN